MKFPEIQYGQTQSFKLPSPWTPIKVSRAQTSVLENIAEPITTIHDSIQKDRALQYYGKTAIKLAELEAQASTEPDATIAPSIVKEGIQEIDAQAKDELSGDSYRYFKQKFDTKAGNLHTGFIVSSAKRANSEQRESFVADIGSIARSGDIDTSEEMIADATMFSDEEKEDLIASARQEYEIGLVESVRYSDDPDAIMSMVNHLKSDEYNGTLFGDKRSAAINALENAYANSVSEYEKQRAHTEGRVLGDLKLAITRGEASFYEIEDAYDRFPDIITPSRRSSLMQLAEEVATKKREDNKLSAMVDWALTNGEPLDPKNTDHKKAVNQYYEENATEENAFQLGIDLAAKTNIMPDELQTDFRRLAFLGKPKRVLAVANAWEILERESPLSIEGLGTKQQAIYSTVSIMNRAGAPLDEALEVARENASKPPEQRQLLRNTYSQEYQIEGTRNRLKGMMDSDNGKFDISFWFKGAPEPSPAIMSSYMALEQEYYTLTNGDIELASEMAYKHVGRIFSTSEINGDQQVFAYAPERVTGLPPDWLRKDVKRQAKAHGLDPERVKVVPDAQTAREQGLRSYAVYFMNEFDNPEPADFRWTPDVQRYNKERAKKARKKRESLEKAYEESTYPWPQGSYYHVDFFD